MQRYLRFIIPLVVLAVFVAALWLLHQEIKEYHLRDVIASLEQIPASHLALAVLLTVLNYTVLVGYDLIATRHIGRRLPLEQVAFASFLGYVSA
jgi:phosphatidylglycerol lysyltransferase